MVNKYGSIGAGQYGTLPIVASVEPLEGPDRNYGSHAANARLIAAAPDLLDALKNLYALVQGECPSLLEDDHHDLMVSNAIAKAEGR